ncbi:hypothetical protein [Deinococcus sp.]|uniref:hypothetical protein n=1 Tax=Deinococcus sp. TaxID=47478 RepID=UPI0025EBC920|nr:hypothetical protein [Deinococcus sp.]
MRLRLGSGPDMGSGRTHLTRIRLAPDQMGVLEMHDGARFAVRVLELLPGSDYRVKLTGQA